MEEEQRQESLPIDAKLLSEAVIELNTSRRSVGLYPPEHPITRQSIEKAFALLKKLFELRRSVTLGIAKDVLMIDEYTLDSRNPVFKEFALALHLKGIAAITFHSGLDGNELLLLHTLISDKDSLFGQELIEIANRNGIRHIRLVPIDLSRFTFIEGMFKDPKSSGQALWEDYVYGIMEGRLAGEGTAGIILNIPPEHIAQVLSRFASEAKEESYDRVITSYLSKKSQPVIQKESLSRFMTLIENLSPDMREQFLERALVHPRLGPGEADDMLKDLSPVDIEKMMHVFEKHSALPESLRNLMEKLSKAVPKADAAGTAFSGEHACIDDIELSEDMIKLFDHDQFSDFVDSKYQKTLDTMLQTLDTGHFALSDEVRNATSQAVTDSAFADKLLELSDTDTITREENLELLSRLSELTDTLLETGRFGEVLKIHNSIYSQMIDGKFRDGASSMVEYFFHSEHFISKFIESLRIWGRFQREEAFKLARVLRQYLISPLFSALDNEESPSQRKFYLALLSTMGKEVLLEAVRRLDDKRWYVVRNLIYLIRLCDGADYIRKLRPLIKHAHPRVRLEVLKTLFHFRTPDSVSYLKIFLSEKNVKLREQAIIFSGMYRIKEVVPILTGMLEKRDFLFIDLHLKLLLVHALGKIGAPSALEALRRVYSSKHFFYKDDSVKLRLAIIKSLAKYPLEKARPLLELAVASGNEEIRAWSQALLSGRKHV